MDFATLFRFAAALAFVLGLIAVFALIAQRSGLVPRVKARGTGGDDKRLEVVDVLNVDGKRRLVLIRRDDREHLLMLGGQQDLLVEEGIARGVKAAAPSSQPALGDRS